MQVKEISQEVFDAELEAIAEDEKMLGAIGIGKVDVHALLRGNKDIGMQLVMKWVKDSLDHRIASKALATNGPRDMAAVLLEEPSYVDLPIKFFLVGLRLGQRAEGE